MSIAGGIVKSTPGGPEDNADVQKCPKPSAVCQSSQSGQAGLKMESRLITAMLARVV